MLVDFLHTDMDEACNRTEICALVGESFGKITPVLDTTLGSSAVTNSNADSDTVLDTTLGSSAVTNSTADSDTVLDTTLWK